MTHQHYSLTLLYRKYFRQMSDSALEIFSFTSIYDDYLCPHIHPRQVGSFMEIVAKINKHPPKLEASDYLQSDPVLAYSTEALSTQSKQQNTSINSVYNYAAVPDIANTYQLVMVYSRVEVGKWAPRSGRARP